MVTEFDARRACHWTLLRLAGRVPDGLMTASRRLLAQGRYAEMARVVALAVAGRDIRMHHDDVRCIGELLDADAEPGPATLGEPTYGDPMPRHEFTATEPCPGVRGAHLDRAAVAAVRTEPAVHGIWRAWRIPAAGRCKVAKPVFVVEVDTNADAAGLAARLQDQLIAAGEMYPQVEAYEVGEWLPAYQRTARVEGDLLWSRSADPGIRIAPLIDGFVGVGPGGCEDAEILEDDHERELILRYLDAGAPVLITTAQIYDVIDRDRGRVVPMNFRTDGAWIWNDISSYYLRAYGFRPDRELISHIRANGYEIPQIDGVDEHRAISVLYWSEEEDAATGGRRR
jgi:hypothetical protein